MGLTFNTTKMADGPIYQAKAAGPWTSKAPTGNLYPRKLRFAPRAVGYFRLRACLICARLRFRRIRTQRQDINA
jgi:hypothetical protein